MSTALSYLLPWKFSPTVATPRGLAIAPYTRGLAAQRRAKREADAPAVPVQIGGRG